MLTVHHLNNSRSQRVLWLLEELGLPYEVKRYERDAKTSLAPPELRKVHPLGKSPVITDGALTVAESGAILEYLVDRYGAQEIYDVDFVPIEGAAAVEETNSVGLTYLDHLTHNVFRGGMAKWAAFYEQVFNFREIRYFDIEGKVT
eukprot:gene12244-14969_t